MAQAKKGLGRGLSALIPTDMDFLAEVARGDFSILAPASQSSELSASTQATQASPQEQGSHKQAFEPEAAPASAARAVSQWGSGLEGPRSAAGATSTRDAVLWVAPELIEANPYQPRRSFDPAELSNLSDSIREHGVLQPIIVRPIGMAQAFGLYAEQTGTKFQLIAGERRWRAAQAANLQSVPIIVREVSDQQALELAIIENVQRHDISALDAAIAYKRLSQEFGLSQERIAQRVGKSRPSVANTLRLLDLPPEAQQAIQDGVLSEGHGRAILLAPGQGDRRAALRAILRGKLSVRQAEEMAARIARQSARDVTKSASSHPPAHAPSQRESRELQHQAGTGREQLSPAGEAHEDTALEERLQRILSCRVQVKRRRSGGQIVLIATDDAQLERIAEVLAGK